MSATPALAAVPAPISPNIPVAMLVDASSNRILFARQPDLRFVPASITKVMTAKVAFRLMDQGKLEPATLYTVNDAVAREWSGKGTSLRVFSGEQIPVSMLLRGITTVSANDAAVVLATGYAGSLPAWAELMNAEAKRIGMTRSQFGTPNGWPDQRATYVTARDMVTLGKALIAEHRQLYSRYFGQKWLSWRGFTGQNRDPTIGIVPGADGIKTGFTREAGYNFLGSAERDGRRLFVVIAGAHGGDERAVAARDMLEWGFAAWTTREVFQPGKTIASAQVQGGEIRDVALVARGTVQATLGADETKPIKALLRYEGPLQAPIDNQQDVARLTLISGQTIVGTFPLYPSRDVDVAGPLDRLWNGLAGLFS